MSAELCAQVVRERARRRARSVVFARVGSRADRGGVDRPGAPRGDARRRSGRGEGAVPRRGRAAIRADLVNTDFMFRVLGDAVPRPRPGAARATSSGPGSPRSSTTPTRPRTNASSPTSSPAIRSSHVPRVIDEHSTRRVLTTELATGSRFDEVERWSQEERDLAGEAIYRFVFRSIYRLHAFNGDPHPGNYLFRPGGHVTFLDFGLVKRYEPEEVTLFESLIRTFVVEHDIPAFRRLVEEHDVLRRDPSFTDADIAGVLRPLLRARAATTASSRSTPSTPRRRCACTSTRTARTRTSPASSNVPPAFVITQRINLGLTAVLGRLARDRATSAASPRSCGRSWAAHRRRRWARPKPRGSRSAYPDADPLSPGSVRGPM